MYCRTHSKSTGAFLMMVSVVVLFIVGCSQTSESTPPTSATEDSSQPGPQFITSPAGIQTTPMGDEKTTTKMGKHKGGHLNTRG